MGYFGVLLRTQLKSRLRSGSFLVATGFFLLLTIAFAALLPGNQGSGLTVGLHAQEEIGQETAALLAENTDYHFQSYPTAAALEHALLAGEMHCGYRLEAASVTALATDGSYMRPLLDEIVLAAHAEARLPQSIKDYLENNGLETTGADDDLAKMRAVTTPMTVTVERRGSGSLDTLSARSWHPLLYAVLAQAFLACALLDGLLMPTGRAASLRQLRRLSGRPLASAAAPVLADLLLHLAVLAAADFGVNHFVAGGYSLAGRATALAVLAVLGAAAGLLGAALQRRATAAVSLLPVGLLAGVLCSSAIITPTLLPAGLGLLRFLSPAWYLLQILASFP